MLTRASRLLGAVSNEHEGEALKISKVSIENFRTLKQVEIPFDKITTFIGPNGAGKSTVLRALDWFFNGTKADALTDEDCAFGATGEAIEVQVTFCELTPADRAVLGKYAPAGSQLFTAWKRRAPGGLETLSANAKGLPAFDDIRATTGAAEKRRLYNELRAADVSLGLPVASSAAAVEAAMTVWESDHPEALVSSPEIVQTSLFGFNGNGKMSGLFDFVLVTADLRASEESVDGKSSIISRVLERSVDRLAADEAIEAIVKDSREKQQAVYEAKFKDQLDALTLSLNEVVGSYSPGRKVTVQTSEVELKAPRTTFQLGVVDTDETTSTSVERQGHGFQRTLLISALQLLAQSGAASAEGVICLAIEEPELFQHPIQAQTFAKVLRELAEDSAMRMQVAYATHSPYFVEARHFDQVRRLTRSAGESPEVRVHYSNVDEVQAALQGIAKPATVASQLDGVVSNQLAVALFAHRALVVEGPTEAALFHGIADRGGVGALEAAGTALVAVGGKNSIPLVHAILWALGIPAYALFDGDSGFESRALENGKEAEKIAEERHGHVLANRTNLRYFKLPEEDFPGEQIADHVATFDDHLESFLGKEWPEWAEACAQLEVESGVSLRKNQSAYRTATARAVGSVPQFLTTIIAKLEAAAVPMQPRVEGAPV